MQTETGRLRDHYTEIGLYLADVKKRDHQLYEQVLLWLGNSKSPYFQIDPFNLACGGSDLAANAFPAQLPSVVNFCSGFADFSESES